MSSRGSIVAFAPGRVNLIGDHTDYSGGLVCPMAINLGTTVEVVRGGAEVELTSADDADPAVVDLGVADPRTIDPEWARYVAGVVKAFAPSSGARGRVTTTLPVGAGLSSSAALELALALALGADDLDPVTLAQLCQRAEHLASGVPCGIMDQLISAAGIAGHALLIDCTTLELTPVPVPAEAEIVVVHSGQTRALTGSAYAERRAAVEAAEAALGQALRSAGVDALSGIDDPLLWKRARHVITENARVRAFGAAMAAGDLASAGALMIESHASLGEDFEVSTDRLDALVEKLCAHPGVWGARLTGAGFGGCVVTLASAGAGVADLVRPARAWVVEAADGARLIS